ncbi:MAG: signal recognition particle-docking protein FtsY [Gammaproteobacteria bacterium]|nr:signal recognition particle-docking protein FtsY [Gammaproteobacteria bacterium]
MVAEAAREGKREADDGGRGGRGFLGRLSERLGKTRARLAAGIGDLLLGERELDEDMFEALETALLVTDAGVEATDRIMDGLKKRVSRRELSNAAALRDALRQELEEMLAPMERPFAVRPAQRPFVVLMVGVNGAGKTTTIGKLARQLRTEGRSVVLAAGDTFRAAAVEQLSEWGRRNDTAVIAQEQGADSASVIHDAMEAARARSVDVVLADTAGRLQAKRNLMDELRKIRRVVARFDPEAPHEAILVLDAGTGQNAVRQVAEFDDAVALTGLIVAKLDGSARAGVLFAIAAALRERATPLPVYFIGVGEGVDDLRPFDARKFIEALLAEEGHG